MRNEGKKSREMREGREGQRKDEGIEEGRDVCLGVGGWSENRPTNEERGE